MQQAARLQVGCDKRPHLVRELIVQAQVQKERLGSEGVCAVMNNIVSKAKTFVPDCGDCAGIKEQACSDVEGDCVAIEVKAAQHVFQRTGRTCLFQANGFFQTPHVPIGRTWLAQDVAAVTISSTKTHEDFIKQLTAYAGDSNIEITGIARAFTFIIGGYRVTQCAGNDKYLCAVFEKFIKSIGTDVRIDGRKSRVPGRI